VKLISIACDSCGVDAPDDESCADPCCGRCSHPPATPNTDLLDDFKAHTAHLVAARRGTALVPLSAARLRYEALEALATGHALVEKVLATRWMTVLDALNYGATLTEVAAAMGLDVDEVRAGVMSWLDGQRAEDLIDRAEYMRLRARRAYPAGDGDR
jgi:hypothetical protein